MAALRRSSGRSQKLKELGEKANQVKAEKLKNEQEKERKRAQIRQKRREDKQKKAAAAKEKTEREMTAKLTQRRKAREQKQAKKEEEEKQKRRKKEEKQTEESEREARKAEEAEISDFFSFRTKLIEEFGSLPPDIITKAWDLSPNADMEGKLAKVKSLSHCKQKSLRNESQIESELERNLGGTRHKQRSCSPDPVAPSKADRRLQWARFCLGDALL